MSTVQATDAPVPDLDGGTDDGSRAGGLSRGLGSLTWLVVAGACGLVDALVVVDDRTRILVTSLLVTWLGVLLARSLARPLPLGRSLARLRLGPWVCVGFAIGFGLATLIWLRPAEDESVVVDRTYLIPAALVASLGLVAFAVGHRLAPRLVISSFDRGDTWLRGRSPAGIGGAAVLSLWAVSVVAQGGAIALGSFGYLYDPAIALQATSSTPAVLALLRNIGILSSLLAAWRFAATRTTASLAVLVLVVATQVGLGLFAGMKEDVIIQFVATFAGYAVRRRVRFLPVLLAGSAIVILVVPFVTQYRLELLSGSGRLSASEIVRSVGFEDLLLSTKGASPAESAEQFAERLSRVGDLAVVIQKTPDEVPYLSPVELVQAPVLGAVPRSLWPEKPVLDAGYVMSRVYYGIPKEIYTASAMTPYGDLWRHGGLGVVLCGMAVLGLFVRAVDSRTGNPAEHPQLLFLPMLLFASLVKQEIDYVSLLASLLATFIAVAIACRVVAMASGRDERALPSAGPRPAGAARGRR